MNSLKKSCLNWVGSPRAASCTTPPIPGAGLVKSRPKPGPWLCPKNKPSFTYRPLPTTAGLKRFCGKCANSVRKSSSGRPRESENVLAKNIPKPPYLSAIRLLTPLSRATARDSTTRGEAEAEPTAENGQACLELVGGGCQ